MIISASRRTDIPAYFGRWFLHRLSEGFFLSMNPFNPHQVRRISLLPEDVDAIVFWTKNARPFFPALRELDARGYRYYFLFTLNDYPTLLEPGVPPLAERIDAFRRLSDAIGPSRVVWRYDPIIISSRTPPAYHAKRLAALAEQLAGASERVIISFLDYYSKVTRRLKRLEASHGIPFTALKSEAHRAARERLCEGIGRIAGEHGLAAYSCAEALSLGPFGIERGSCIDGKLINELFHLQQAFPGDANQRSHCGCARAVDLGVYNTCQACCAYCYANLSEEAVRKSLRKHSPKGPLLLGGQNGPAALQGRPRDGSDTPESFKRRP